MGVCCAERRKEREVYGDKQRCRAWEICLVQCQLRRQYTSDGSKTAQQPGIVRHDRECLGVVSGLVWGEELQSKPPKKSLGATKRNSSCPARRRLGLRTGGHPGSDPVRAYPGVPERPLRFSSVTFCSMMIFSPQWRFNHLFVVFPFRNHMSKVSKYLILYLPRDIIIFHIDDPSAHAVCAVKGKNSDCCRERHCSSPLKTWLEAKTNGVGSI